MSGNVKRRKYKYVLVEIIDIWDSKFVPSVVLTWENAQNSAR